jgi:hypothetical protein
MTAMSAPLQLPDSTRPPRFSRLPPHPGAAPAIRVFQLPPAAIQYLTALWEAYDGIGLVRTLDERRGIIECWMMPDFLPECERLLETVARDWPVQALNQEAKASYETS